MGVEGGVAQVHVGKPLPAACAVALAKGLVYVALLGHVAQDLPELGLGLGTAPLVVQHAGEEVLGHVVARILL